MSQQDMLLGGQASMQYPGTGGIPQMVGGYYGGQPVGGQMLTPGGPQAMQGAYSPAAASVMQQQLQYQHIQQQHIQQLQLFWQQQMQEVEQASDFKNHQLPLARIKKIMKADEDVRMISAEAPVVFSKACEMFILELTLRSWIHTEENKRRTLQKNDIAGAITRTDIFDFLVDIVPRDELKEEGSIGIPRSSAPIPGPEMQYGNMYYPSPGGAAPAAGMGQPGIMQQNMMVGRPAMGMDSSMYGQQRPNMYMQHVTQQQQQSQQQQQMWQQMPPSAQ